jgi:hypothetical protein
MRRSISGSIILYWDIKSTIEEGSWPRPEIQVHEKVLNSQQSLVEERSLILISFVMCPQRDANRTMLCHYSYIKRNVGTSCWRDQVPFLHRTGTDPRSPTSHSHVSHYQHQPCKAGCSELKQSAQQLPDQRRMQNCVNPGPRISTRRLTTWPPHNDLRPSAVFKPPWPQHTEALAHGKVTYPSVHSSIRQLTIAPRCLFHPQSVISLGFTPAFAALANATTRLCMRCFGAQAMTCALVLGTADMTVTSFTAFGLAMVPYLVAWNLWFGIGPGKGMINKWMWLDCIGNLFFMGGSLWCARLLKEEEKDRKKAE